jgi:DNA-binding HxlR family transcriptional regulator
MESDGLVIREEFKELPPRVEYSLTEKGLALLPILYLLEEWEAKFTTENFNSEKNCSLLDKENRKKAKV